MEKKNVYANLFGFLAGLTNSLSITTIGVSTTHVTGTATNISVDLGSLNLPSFELFIGLFASFIVGSALAVGLMKKRGFISSILFAGALMIIVGIFAPTKMSPRSMDQFIFGFLVATAMGARNASTASTPIGKTTHLTGVSQILVLLWLKGMEKNLFA